MVMAASPSAATGATGLERLLLIFLINFSEPQEYSKQHSNHDRISDQSEKTQETAQELQEHRKPSQKNHNFTKKPQFPRGQPNKRKNSNFHQTDCAQATKDLTPPIEKPNERFKTQIHRTKLKETANDSCTSTQPRRKPRKLSRTHAVDGSKFYTAPRWAPDDPAC